MVTNLIGSRTADMNDTFTILDRRGNYILSEHVLCKGCIEYCTHFYNEERNGSDWGKYFRSFEEAFDNMVKRDTRKL